MNPQRRTLLGAGALAGVSTLANLRPAAAAARFPFLEATITQLQSRLQAGRLTTRTLAAAYLARIEEIDRHGPKINSIIEVNPDALRLAAELDRERKAGTVRGPLHGIPVLLKDNIATADRMQTTAGSLALLGAKAPRDAFVAARLRASGALILGKTNLSEWANIRSSRSSSGWSGRGGLTRNPYALDRSASGSSSGTAVSIAANLAVAGVGTETDGSITSPASACGIVGLKPTVGLVSRDGIVPISHSQDTAGPMARSVTDAALVLAAIAGTDPRDTTTAGAPPPIDYAAGLDADSLRGVRLGVVRNVGIRHAEVAALLPDHEARWLVEEVHPEAEMVVLVLDNLNTHKAASLYEAFPPEQARAILERLEIHHTPKHGSWLNIAENELSSLTRQCIAGRRFGDVDTLSKETSAWSSDVNETQRGGYWQMTIEDARCKLKSVYPKIKL